MSVDLTREQIEQMFERSKDDHGLFVGSEIRLLCQAALRSLASSGVRQTDEAMWEQMKGGVKRVCDAHTKVGRATDAYARGYKDAAEDCGTEIQALPYPDLPQPDVAGDEDGLVHSASASSGGLDRASGDGGTNAMRDVIAERRRQIDVEGWTPEHDDGHNDGNIAVAGACYAFSGASQLVSSSSKFWQRRFASVFRDFWPWDEQWRKPKDARRDLVRAAALIIAEIERLDRASGGYALPHSDASINDVLG